MLELAGKQRTCMLCSLKQTQTQGGKGRFRLQRCCLPFLYTAFVP